MAVLGAEAQYCKIFLLALAEDVSFWCWFFLGQKIWAMLHSTFFPSMITHDNYLPLAWSFTQRKKSCISCVWDHPHFTFFQDCPSMSVQEKDTLLFLRQFLAFYYRAYTVRPVYVTLRERGANFTQNSRGGLQISDNLNRSQFILGNIETTWLNGAGEYLCKKRFLFTTCLLSCSVDMWRWFLPRNIFAISQDILFRQPTIQGVPKKVCFQNFEGNVEGLDFGPLWSIQVILVRLGYFGPKKSGLLTSKPSRVDIKDLWRKIWFCLAFEHLLCNT